MKTNHLLATLLVSISMLFGVLAYNYVQLHKEYTFAIECNRFKYEYIRAADEYIDTMENLYGAQDCTAKQKINALLQECY